jgi:hypothetical protein
VKEGGSHLYTAFEDFGQFPQELEKRKIEVDNAEPVRILTYESLDSDRSRHKAHRYARGRR